MQVPAGEEIKVTTEYIRNEELMSKVTAKTKKEGERMENEDEERECDGMRETSSEGME